MSICSQPLCMVYVMKTIQIWGDSVLRGVVYDEETQRYSTIDDNSIALAAEETKLNFLNSSRFGMTAKKACDLLLSHLKKKPEGDIAIIEYGGNDCNFKWEEIAVTPNDEHTPNTPVEVFKGCVQTMITALKKINIRPVLMTLPPLDAGKFFDWVTKSAEAAKNVLAWLGDVERIYRWQELYSLTILELAQENDVPVIDTRKAFLTSPNFKSLLCRDGMHPNQNGQKVIANAIVEFFSKLKPQAELIVEN